MERLLIAVAAAAALWVVAILALAVLARRLPPGMARDLAGFLPACVTTARRLRADPAVPRRAEAALLLAIAWVLCPIDLVPDVVPVLGVLDDVVAVVLLLRWAARRVPPGSLEAAWPGEPRLLRRLVG